MNDSNASTATAALLEGLIEDNYDSALDESGSITIANPKLAMFERNKQEALINYFMVADYLESMGLPKTLSIFKIESDFDWSKLKNEETQNRMIQLENDAGEENTVLSHVLDWYVQFLDNSSADLDASGYLKELKEHLGWENDQVVAEASVYGTENVNQSNNSSFAEPYLKRHDKEMNQSMIAQTSLNSSSNVTVNEENCDYQMEYVCS